MISVLASTTVGSRDADEEPTGMYLRRVVEVSTEVRSCKMLTATTNLILVCCTRYINY